MPLLAVVTLPYVTGLPRDVSVNTFSFIGQTEEEAEDYTPGLIDFYTAVPTDRTNTIGSKISGVVNRGTNLCTIEWYNRADAPPRVPIHTARFTMPNASGDNLPLEVACCCSFQAAPASGQSQARRRGRVFLGPLKASALTSNATDAPRFTGFMADVAAAAQDLQIASASAVPGGGWSVFSKVGGTNLPVVSGWVNNEPDTQRRRQVEATARLAWSSLV